MQLYRLSNGHVVSAVQWTPGTLTNVVKSITASPEAEAVAAREGVTNFSEAGYIKQTKLEAVTIVVANDWVVNDQGKWSVVDPKSFAKKYKAV